ncbi:hypothetical protein SAMN05216569_3294 [Pseudoxanthomonas sp. CF125]|nr:hypothetical protein SAMN05216569_3294 [Pseudoxanthomonas sp. CF125]
MFKNSLRILLLTGAGLLWAGLAQAQCPPGMYHFSLHPISRPLARLFLGMAINRRRKLP